MGRYGSSKMSATGNQRRASLVGCGLALCAFAALLLRFPPATFEFYPVCPIHAWTGLLCPGCGATRALAALLRGHLAEAWRHNALIVGLAPFGLLYGAFLVRRVWRGGIVWVPVPGRIWVLVGLVTAGFTVMRNLG